MLKEYDIFYDNVNVCYQIRTKSNTFAIEFDEDEKKAIFNDLIEFTRNADITLTEANKALIKKGHAQPDIISVFQGLVDYNLIPSHEIAESGLTFNSNTQEFGAGYPDPKSLSIWIIGDSPLSKALKTQFAVHPFKQLDQSSIGAFLERRDHDENALLAAIDSYDLLIIDGHRWNPHFLEYINKVMVKKNKPWLFVGGIEEGKLKIGPFFWGRDTGCYSCLLKRLKSNNEYAGYLDSYEAWLKSERISAKSDEVPHMDVLYNIAANYALLETLKLFEGWAVPTLWKTMMTIQPFTYELNKHTLLKVPYCEVCKPKVKYNLAAWLEPLKATS